MSTGLDSFSDPGTIGALYPFAGVEVLFVIVGIAVWIGWHVRQTREEDAEYRAAVDRYEQIGLERVMREGTAEVVPPGGDGHAEAPSTPEPPERPPAQPSG